MDLLLSVIGLAALVGAGDALVRGAVALSLRLGIPALIVSLTVVAFGTSAPEMLVGVEAALEDADGIVFGNVVGSNIANVLLVLGLPALIAPIDPRGCDTRRNYNAMIAASLVLIVLCMMGPLVWWHGLILVSGLGWMLVDAYLASRKAGCAAPCEDPLAELEDADPDMARWKIATLIGVGVVGLPLGAHLLIEGARGVAAAAGLSEAAIGLTLVAIGTSLPELATSVAAAMRNRAEVALGNVVGSNLFNILAIMGVVSFLGPVHTPPGFLTLDLWMMLGASAILGLFIYPRIIIGRWMGLALLATYTLYAAVVLGPRM